MNKSPILALFLAATLTACAAPSTARPLDALSGADELRALLPRALDLEGPSLTVEYLGGESWEGRDCWRYDFQAGDQTGTAYRVAETGELWAWTKDAPARRLSDGAGGLLPDDPLTLLPPTALDLQPDGLSAALFGRAYAALTRYGTPEDDLVLTRVHVLGSYEEGDATYYLCHLWTYWYYDFLQERGANQGGGEDCAVIPLRADPDRPGQYLPAGEVQRGGDDQTWGEFFQMCGAPPDLCARIDADPQPQVLLETLPLDQLYAAYLAKLFGPIDDTNKNKEAAAEAYLAALRAAGPGEERYDALVQAFGPNAWDRVELSYTLQSTPSNGQIWRVDLTAESKSAGHFTVANTTGPWTLCQGLTPP